MRKITRRLAVLTSAAALAGFGLSAAGGSVALAAGQNGTTLTTASVTASATNDAYYPWTLSKTVSPDTLNLFKGDTGSAHFTVTATKGSLQVLGPKVCGTVSVTNDGAVATENLAADLDVSDPPNGSPTHQSQALDVSGNPVLDPGETGNYNYCIQLGSWAQVGETYKVTANITITNHSGHLGVPFGPNPSDTFTVPSQTVHNGTVTVDDTNSGSGAPWTFSDSGSQSYDVSYSTAGDFTNTATLHQEKDYGGDIQAQATVHVNVYKLSVSKTADTSYTRTWTWTVNKSADQSALTLAQGETFPVNYKVHVSAASADSDRRVHGQITVTNPAPMDATVSVADIMPGGVGVTLTDDQNNPLPTSVTVPASGQLVVNYQSDQLSSGDPGTNQAKVTQTLPISGGTQEYDGSADFAFGDPTKVVNGQASLSDTYPGANLPSPINATDMPKDYNYQRLVGPYSATGTYSVDNTVTVTGSDGQTDSSSTHVTVNVPSNGCTLTIGYWKNHQAQTAMYLPIWLGTPNASGSVQVTTASQASSVLSFGGQASNGINKLLGQLLGAKLDIASGADPSAVASTISAADAFLASHPASLWSTLTKAQQQQVNSWMSQLDNYNNGLTGPGHCTQ